MWGCVDPNVAPSMNDDANPNRHIPEWVEQMRVEGQCVLISPNSLWEPLSQDYNGLTYVAYRGTVGRPGSFWVPTSALEAATPMAAVPPTPNPLAVAPSPLAPPRPEPRHFPVETAPLNTDPPSPAAAPEVVHAPSQPQPNVTEAPSPQTPTSGVGVWFLLVLLGGAWLVSRVFRGGKRSQRATRNAALPTASTVSSPKTAARNATKVLQPTRSAPSITKYSSGEPSFAWQPPGAPVAVVGVTIPDGMVYVGRSKGQWGAHDASLIDPALPVARTSSGAGPLGYWPSYKDITPECRRRYLEWLASGKQAAEADIGYVFLYFYGLERRLLLDEPSAAEVHAIAAELHRLRAIYASNGSFNSYSNRLLDAVAFLQDAANASPTTFVPNLNTGSGEMPLALKVAIAREVVAGRPLGFELAAAALFGLHDFQSSHRHVFGDARPAFLAVLRHRFATTFPAGFLVRNRKDSHLELAYAGASAGLRLDLATRVSLKGLPDPTTLTWTKLVTLGGAVAEELAPYAKALAYHPARANSLYGLVGCPLELRDVVAPEARNWLSSLPSPAAVPFGELAARAIGTATAKWTMRHRRQVSEALSIVGYAMEPDPEDGAERLEDSTTVQIFRCSDVIRSRAMAVASAAAMLVVAVTKATEHGVNGVAENWLSKVPARLTLTPDQTTRLKAQLAWMSTKTVTLAKAKRVLGNATQEEREFCAWSAMLATTVAGKVGKPQVALLEAIHDALEIPRNTLYAGLHTNIAAAAMSADEPILVSEEIAETLHAIPGPAVGVMLDPEPNRLAQVRRETEKASAILAEIFVEEEPQPQEQETNQDGMLAGLDAQHVPLVAQLLSRSAWSRREFDAAASDLGLMPSGAMETINEWAFDHFGDALLEDGDTVAVNHALLPADQGSAAAQ